MRYVLAGLAIILFLSVLQGESFALKPPSGRSVMVIAHRGASGYAPENTMASFKMAHEMGADMIEFDVYHSADGVLVVMHDDKVDRTTDGTGEIEKMALEQIRKLDAGAKFDKKFSGEKVPTFEELLEWASGKILINIEIKGAGCEEKIVELLRKYKMVDKTIISSFHHEYLAKIRELEPAVETGALIGDVKDVDLKSIVEICHPNAINPRVLYLDKKQVADIHAMGMAVNVYTVNDVAYMRQMMRIKSDGIITNNPDQLIKIVEGKKKTDNAEKTQ